MEKHKIIITKCSDNTFWYAQQIGSKFTVDQRPIGSNCVKVSGTENLFIEELDVKYLPHQSAMSAEFEEMEREKAVKAAKEHKQRVADNPGFLDMLANDPVNRPAHYTSGKIEVIDFIEDQKLTFHLGNAVKYIARAGKKDPAKFVEDLQKSVWYIERAIEGQPVRKAFTCLSGTDGCNGFMVPRREGFKTDFKTVCNTCGKPPVNVLSSNQEKCIGGTTGCKGPKYSEFNIVSDNLIEKGVELRCAICGGVNNCQTYKP